MEFDVIKNKTLEPREELPEYFLSESALKAERIYKDFSVTLNSFAYTYSVSTGIDKSDLFAEALIALAFAAKDFNSERSKKFKTYAIYRIKDALNEYVRKNVAIVEIPMNIKKSNANIMRIKTILEKTGDLTFEEFIETWSLAGHDLSEEDHRRCMISLKYVVKAAERAKMPFKRFIDRIEHLPVELKFDDFEQSDGSSVREMEKLEAALVVQDLRKSMTRIQKIIADGIMEGKTLTQIAKAQNKTRVWASTQLSELRKKFGESVL